MRDLNPKVISVPLKEKSYNIYFQEGLINFTDKLLRPIDTGQKWIIVSPKSISKTYGSNIFTILKKTGFDINILQKWMKFIGLLEQVWEISLTKIIKKL